MWWLITIPLTCWTCAFVARPREPLPGQEIQELVYTRLLGRQQRLPVLAVIATATLLLTFLVGMPERVDRDLAVIRQAHAACRALVTGGGAGSNHICYEPQPGGGWRMEVVHADGSRHVIATIAAPLFAPTGWDDPHTANR